MEEIVGKKYLVLGVANEQSIAWGISKGLHKAGAKLGFTYLNEALEKRVRPLAGEVGSDLIVRCDVQNDQELDTAFEQVKAQWGTIDGVIHSIAFADKKDLQNRFLETSRDGFKLAMDVSAYSLIAVAKRAEPLMKEKGGSIITLTYLGAERVVPHYNVMGAAKAALEASVRYLAADLGPSNIRVNAISAGPVRTLAAYGIPHFRDLHTSFAAQAPLRRNTTHEDVAGASIFLLSSLGSGVTGEVIYVDSGYNIMGAEVQ